jgi:hypothetical protein
LEGEINACKVEQLALIGAALLENKRHCGASPQRSCANPNPFFEASVMN